MLHGDLFILLGVHRAAGDWIAMGPSCMNVREGKMSRENLNKRLHTVFYDLEVFLSLQGPACASNTFWEPIMLPQ